MAHGLQGSAVVRRELLYFCGSKHPRQRGFAALPGSRQNDDSCVLQGLLDKGQLPSWIRVHGIGIIKKSSDLYIIKRYI